MLWRKRGRTHDAPRIHFEARGDNNRPNPDKISSGSAILYDKPAQFKSHCLNMRSAKPSSMAPATSRPNQRQKFLAEYYRAQDGRTADPTPHAPGPAEKRRVLACSADGGRDSPAGRPGRVQSAVSSFKGDADCRSIIGLCTEKLMVNPTNEKALSLRATAHLRRKDYLSVIRIVYRDLLGDERLHQTTGSGR